MKPTEYGRTGLERLNALNFFKDCEKLGIRADKVYEAFFRHLNKIPEGARLTAEIEVLRENSEGIEMPVKLYATLVVKKVAAELDPDSPLSVHRNMALIEQAEGRAQEKLEAKKKGADAVNSITETVLQFAEKNKNGVPLAEGDAFLFGQDVPLTYDEAREVMQQARVELMDTVHDSIFAERKLQILDLMSNPKSFEPGLVPLAEEILGQHPFYVEHFKEACLKTGFSPGEVLSSKLGNGFR